MIRIRLYGISGKEQAVYEFEPDYLATDGVQPLVIEPRPVFTVERIVVEAVTEQLEIENAE